MREREPSYPPEYDDDPIGEAAKEIVDRIATVRLRAARDTNAPTWLDSRREMIQWVADIIEEVAGESDEG